MGKISEKTVSSELEPLKILIFLDKRPSQIQVFFKNKYTIFD